jgi:hypothetical protein
MTASELIEQLKTFHPSDEIEVAGRARIKQEVPIYDDDDKEIGSLSIDTVQCVRLEVGRVTHNNGARRRVLIATNEIE